MKGLQVPRVSQPARVVFTALFGCYEKLNEQPLAKESRIPFLCFTDRTDLVSETWRIVPVPMPSLLAIDTPRQSRHPKLLSHRYLAEYDESLYIDNSCVLKQSPETIFSGLLPDTSRSFVALRHPWRSCAYDEAEAVVQQRIDDPRRVHEQMRSYERLGYPRHQGLIAGTFLLRRHHDPSVQQHGEMWFSHVLRYSKRDQLSFNFCAWRCGLQFTAEDFDLSSNPFFDWPVVKDRIPRDVNGEDYQPLSKLVAEQQSANERLQATIRSLEDKTAEQQSANEVLQTTIRSLEDKTAEQQSANEVLQTTIRSLEDKTALWAELAARRERQATILVDRVEASKAEYRRLTRLLAERAREIFELRAPFGSESGGGTSTGRK